MQFWDFGKTYKILSFGIFDNKNKYYYYTNWILCDIDK